MPAGGARNPARAASKTVRPATHAGPRGARCTGAGEGPPVCTRRFQEARSEAELRGKNLGGAAVERREASAPPPYPSAYWKRGKGRAAAPQAQTSGNICLRGAEHGWMRLSALRLPSPPACGRVGGGGETITKLGRGCVARTNLFSPLPAARGEVGLRSNPGEGAPPRILRRDSEPSGEAPSPRPSPRTRGEGARMRRENDETCFEAARALHRYFPLPLVGRGRGGGRQACRACQRQRVTSRPPFPPSPTRGRERGSRSIKSRNIRLPPGNPVLDLPRRSNPQ